MKKIVFLTFIIFVSVAVKAQLANTKWNATLQLDQPVDVVFSFGTDTLDVVPTESQESLETMTYSIKDTVITLQKIVGQSSCDNTSIGTYSFKISGDELWLKVISDNCDDRSRVIGDFKLKKAQ